jgi:hypothetical protein
MRSFVFLESRSSRQNRTRHLPDIPLILLEQDMVLIIDRIRRIIKDPAFIPAEREPFIDSGVELPLGARTATIGSARIQSRKTGVRPGCRYS